VGRAAGRAAGRAVGKPSTPVEITISAWSTRDDEKGKKVVYKQDYGNSNLKIP
jgi:hypothetical protein